MSKDIIQGIDQFTRANTMASLRVDVIQRLGLGALAKVRNNRSFPFKTGNLKYNATRAEFSNDSFKIIFDTTIAPYIPYLEKGVEPQVYFRKGKPIFTRGSMRHRGFISEAATLDIITYLSQQFHKQVSYLVVNNQGKQYGEIAALKKDRY